MVWQRMIQRLVRRNRRSITEAKCKSRRRVLRHESLVKRELLASDLGAISGVSFADLAQDGLTADDERLVGVTIDLFRDVDGSGTLTAADGAAIDSTVSDANGMYFFRGLDIDTFIVQQQPAPGRTDLIAPDPITVNIADDSGAVLAIVDDFTQTDQVVTADGNNPVDSSSISAPEVVGGFRDIKVTRTSDVGILNVVADSNDDTLSIGSQTSGVGVVLVQYDGDDGTTDLDPTGLGGISLGGGNAGDAIDPDAGILIEAFKEVAGDTVTIRIFTDATNFATASDIAIPIDSGVPGQQEDVFVRYLSDFVVTGNPDFNDVGAIEFEITVTGDNDGTFAAFTVRGPNVETRNLPNEQLMTLGGSLFDDLGGGADTNNGMFDASEFGVAGVTIDLYGEPAGGGAIDPVNQTAISTTTTDANGDYLFAQLGAGNYLVVIPESEFASGEPLFGFISSTGLDPVPDPNNNVKGDDNANLVAGLGIVTLEITLTPGDEPVDDGDNDPNTNLTLGMGVTEVTDLVVSKSIDAANSNLEALGQAIYDITYLNDGLIDATGLVLTDVLPAGLTINLADSDFAGFTPVVDGQTITVAIGTLAPGANGSIRIAADIANGQTDDVTNVASADADQVEADPNSATAQVTVSLVNSDLVITKSDNTDGSVVAGEQFTYTITVSNNGPDGAEGIVGTDNLPSDLSFVSATFTAGSGTVTENPVDSGNLSIAIDDLASSDTAVIDVIVLVASDAADTISNTTTVIGNPNTDTDSSNNSATETTPVVRNVDVFVTKTADTAAVAGSQLTYTIQVGNSDLGDARGVEVTDTLDSQLTFVSFDAGTSGVTVTQVGQVLTFDVGTLTASEVESFSFVVDLASSATGTLNNQATITTTDTDTDPSNDTDDVDSSIDIDTDLMITKGVDLTTAVPGQDTLTYSFTITHDTDSNSDSGEVTFTDVLPTGLTGLTIDAPDATSSEFDSANQTVTIVYAPIAIGIQRSFTITASVNEDATGTLVNEGSFVVAGGGDSDPSNDSDTAQTDLTPEFDLSITKTADDTTPDPGSNVTYTIDLTNAGPSTATGVVLTDDVPNGMTFVSGTLDGQDATLSGDIVTFSSITLDDGEVQSATLIFTVGVDASGSITNTANVTADPGESDPSDNTATEDVDVTAQADLSVTKSVNQTGAKPGDTLVYTIIVTNQGVSTADASTAVDTLPDGVTFVSGTGPDGDLSAVNGVVTVDGGNLAPNGTFTITINATVDVGATGTLTNEVIVSTTTNESDETNNDASAETIVDPFLSTIGGATYVDANDNGIRDDGEVGIEGVMITLSGTDSLGNAINEVVTTDDNGDYIFAQLAAGLYRVDQTQPGDFRNGQTTVGTGATATAIDNAFTDLDLGSTADAIDFNFGELAHIMSKRRFLAST